MMRKILRTMGFVLGLAATTTANAQLPDNAIMPAGVQLTSYTPATATALYTPGVTHDIDSYLDAGIPVLIDAYAVWCGPCWNYHNNGTLENLYNSIGDGGTGQVKIFGVEADGSTPAATLESGGNTLGDWITGTHYPVCNDDNIAGIINLAYYPTLILICPDRTVTEVGQGTLAALTAAVNACGSLSTSANDPRIVAETTGPSVISCNGSAPTIEISVAIQNYSTAAISGDYTIKAFDASNTEVASTVATLNLAPYAATSVTIGTVTPPAGNNTYTAKITTANDDLTNDEFAVPVLHNSAIDLPVLNGVVNLTVTLDAYPAEVGVIFDAGLPPAGATFAQLHNAQIPTQTAIGFAQVGTLTGATYSASYTVSSGCHYFAFIDSYGDGLAAPGGAAITTTAGGSDNVSGAWGGGTFAVYNFNETASVKDVNGLNASISVYPNPTNGIANVTLALNEFSNVSIQLMNTLGQVVYTDNLGEINGENKIQIETSNLEEGVYFVNVNVNGVIGTQRLSVIK